MNNPPPTTTSSRSGRSSLNLPSPPLHSPSSARNIHSSLSLPTSGGSTSSQRRVVGSLARGLPQPPPPPVNPQMQQSKYSQSIASSMTIEEMRALHQRALSEAEAKRTELRLVLASRYRELVGSSDEVIRMNERALELHDLVYALPGLIEKLAKTLQSSSTGSAPESESKADTKESSATADSNDTEVDVNSKKMVTFRRNLTQLPRVVHRALDAKNVHIATTTLIELFNLIASQTDIYPLASALASSSATSDPQNGAAGVNSIHPAIATQMRMVFLQMQTIPNKISRISERVLLRAASYGEDVEDPSLGAQTSAAALSSLDLLAIEKKSDRDRSVQLLDTYFDSKAQLLVFLLNQLTTQNATTSKQEDGNSSANNAETILSKIVLILQYDVIVHPYQIFLLRNFPCKEQQAGGCGEVVVKSIMRTLPQFDPELVKSRCSKFLAAHLPLIRTKVKSVLVTIAGTTASALGQIRQSLYDKTDGAECMELLDGNGICTWDEAVQAMINVGTVLSHTEQGSASSGVGGNADQVERKISLWSALFSNTFSSLVHSLLTTSFQSVHQRVVSTLRTSLANAPSLSAILPHEAYRNTLCIATELDAALLKVSDDAHELLVHAEERLESERRLRQSLYVQTCEIMGRLVCELRRMVFLGDDDESEATKELIVGRLCYLLKFRLTSLPKLLDPKSSPAAMQSTSGMISYVDLKSAFELADDNEDGLITFEEAMEAAESAFSGTQFRGAQMVRETLLLLPTADTDVSGNSVSDRAPESVTLNELTLLTARGIRHDTVGSESALGIVQKSLDDIVEGCFQEWAAAALSNSLNSFDASLRDFLHVTASVDENEWKRTNPSAEASSFSGKVDPPSGKSTMPIIDNVSPYVVGYFLDVSSTLNGTTCPSDSLTPVPSTDYASSLGVTSPLGDSIPTLVDTIRLALLRQSLVSLGSVLEASLSATEFHESSFEQNPKPALLQLYLDASFVESCLFKRNRYGFTPREGINSFVASSRESIEKFSRRAKELVHKTCNSTELISLSDLIDQKHQLVLGVSDLFFSSLFGEDPNSAVLSSGDVDVGLGTSSSGSAPIFRSPLASTRRFVLLPIQSDRSLSDLQLRGKYVREKEVTKNPQESVGGGVVSSGLGFLSSMLKKK